MRSGNRPTRLNSMPSPTTARSGYQQGKDESRDNRTGAGRSSTRYSNSKDWWTVAAAKNAVAEWSRAGQWRGRDQETPANCQRRHRKIRR